MYQLSVYGDIGSDLTCLTDLESENVKGYNVYVRHSWMKLHFVGGY